MLTVIHGSFSATVGLSISVRDLDLALSGSFCAISCPVMRDYRHAVERTS